MGWLPTVKWRSLARWVQTVWSSLSISNVPIAVPVLSRQPTGIAPRQGSAPPRGDRARLTLSESRGVHQNGERAFRFTPIDSRAVVHPHYPDRPARIQALHLSAAQTS